MKYLIHLTTALLLATPAFGAVDAKQIAAIDQALPTEALAPVKTPRKMLVFTLTKGFRHSSIPTGVEALKRMGEKTGAYTIEESTDIEVFRPDSLKRFDVICFLSTTGTLFTDPELKQSLLDFVSNGKGIMGIHAATDCFYDWPEFGKMMGGYFHGHPWGAGDTVTLKIDDPEHACNACFKGMDHFTIKDEIYQFRPEPYSRDVLRVLTSLDTNLTDMSKGGIKRTDGDFGVSWLRSYGKGRVFYCSMGHREDIFWNPVVMKHYLAGIQFAAGDLEGDTTPSARMPKPSMGPALAAYTFGQRSSAYQGLVKQAQYAGTDPEKKAEVEKQLLETLAHPKVTPAAIQLACELLMRVGSDTGVPALAALLDNETTANDGRMALQAIGTPKAAEAMVATLKGSSGDLRLGLINSLGALRASGAEAALTALLKDSDLATVEAAARALVKIGPGNAAPALAPLQSRSPILKQAWLEAMAQSDDPASQKALREILFDTEAPVHHRNLALNGLSAQGGKASAGLLTTLLEQKNDPVAASLAAVALRDQASPADVADVAQRCKDLSAETQLSLLPMIAFRGDEAAVAPVVALASADDADAGVRIAAVHALGQLPATRHSATTLLSIALSDIEEANEAARNALKLVQGDVVDQITMELAGKGNTAERLLAIELLGDRSPEGAAKCLFSLQQDAEASIRTGALKSLASVSGAQDYPAAVNWLVNASDGKERSQSEKTVVEISRKMVDAEARVAPLRDALKAGASVEASISMAKCLNYFGGPEALEALTTLTQSGNPQLVREGIKYLSRWKDKGSLYVLVKAAAASHDKEVKQLAFEGFKSQFNQHLPSLTEDELGRGTRMLYERAQSAEEQVALITALGERGGEAALKLLNNLRPTAATVDAHSKAIEAIKVRLAGPPKCTASNNSGEAGLAVDGNAGSRWTSGGHMRPGMWFQVEFPGTRTIRKLVLDTKGSAKDHPQGYKVFVGDNPESFGAPVVTGKGGDALMEIALPEGSRGRFIRIEQLGTSDRWYWSIHELTVE